MAFFGHGKGALEHDEHHARQQDRDGQKQHSGDDGADRLLVTHTSAHDHRSRSRALNHTAGWRPSAAFRAPKADGRTPWRA